MVCLLQIFDYFLREPEVYSFRKIRLVHLILSDVIMVVGLRVSRDLILSKNFEYSALSHHQVISSPG